MGIADARATPRCTYTPASRSRPAPSARASPTASGMGVAERFLRAVRPEHDRPSHLRRFAVTATSWKASATRRRHSPGSSGSAGSSMSSTTTTSPSTARPSSATIDDVPKRFEAYGWHIEHLGEVANDLDALEAGLRRGHGRGRSAVALSFAAISAGRRRTALTPRRPTVTPRCRGDPPHQRSPRPASRTRTSTSRTRSRRSTASAPGVGRRRVEDWEQRQAAVSRRGSRAFEAMPERRGHDWLGRRPARLRGRAPSSPPERPSTSASTPRCRASPGSSPAPATSRATRASTSTAAGCSRAADPGGTSSTTASASTPWRLHDRDGAARRRPSGRRDVLRLQRLRRGRRFASPRYLGGARRSISSPTTRSGSARTARRTSRSSSWPRCGRCRDCRLIRPADANEIAAAWQIAVDSDGPTALVLTRQDVPVLAERPPCTADRRRPAAPTSSCPGARAGRARPGAHRHRQRGSALPRRGRPAGVRRDRRSCRVVPELGSVRRAGGGVPRWRPAGRRAQALGRGGRVLRLGPLRRRDACRSTATARLRREQ